MSISHHYAIKDHTFGLLLLKLREKAALTQTAVAGLINVSEKAVYNWEAGSDYPTSINLKKLIEIYMYRGVFTVGNEREEARTIWKQITLCAPRRKATFDDEWFSSLLRTYQQAQGDTRPVKKDSEVIENMKSTIDWSHAPDVSSFCGRRQELQDLTRCLLQDRCRVVTLFGMGGIGKTTLATKVAHQIRNDFQYILWRSLKNAPSLSELLLDCIAFFSKQLYTQRSTENDIAVLLDLFRSQRCLLILDNVETILQPGQSNSSYLTGYEDYELLIKCIAESSHQSCILLTGREKLKVTGPLETPSSVVRSLLIKGLNLQESQELLRERMLYGDEQTWQRLIQAYAGNPLALKMASEIIYDLFSGNIAHFLEQDEIYFNGIRQLLEQQIARLSSLEQDLLYCLTMARIPVSIATLRSHICPDVFDDKLVEGLHALYRRSLLEQKDGHFTLQPILLEYITKQVSSQ